MSVNARDCQQQPAALEPADRLVHFIINHPFFFLPLIDR
jgi:hypothetical protein